MQSINDIANIDGCLEELNKYKITKNETYLVKALDHLYTEIKNSPNCSPNISPNSSFTNLVDLQKEDKIKSNELKNYMYYFNFLEKDQMKEYLYRGC